MGPALAVLVLGRLVAPALAALLKPATAAAPPPEDAGPPSPPKITSYTRSVARASETKSGSGRPLPYLAQVRKVARAAAMSERVFGDAHALCV